MNELSIKRAISSHKKLAKVQLSLIKEIAIRETDGFIVYVRNVHRQKCLLPMIKLNCTFGNAKVTKTIE
jgi:hypothetical protein